MSGDGAPAGGCLGLHRLALSCEGKSPRTLAFYFANLKRFATYLESRAARAAVLSDFTPGRVSECVSV